MQAASLQNGFFKSRADTHSFGSPAGGQGHRSKFDSILSKRSTDRAATTAKLPQDERTINRQRDEASVASDQPVTKSDEVQQTRRSGGGQEEQNGGSGDPSNSGESVAKKSTGEKGTAGDDSDDVDTQSAFSAVMTNQPIAPAEQPTPTVTVEKAVAPAVEADPIQQALQAAIAAETPVAPIAAQAAVGTVVENSKSAGNTKLQDVVEQMQPASAEGEFAAKAVEAATSDAGDADAQSDDLLGKELAQQPDAQKPPEPKTAPSSFDRELGSLVTGPQQQAKPEAAQALKMQPAQTFTPEQKFAQDNIDQVVTSVKTQSLNGGGQMNVRLDPPELGALQVAVKMIEGRLTASFTTSNDQATQLLSHNLQHLKSSLEATGVNVDRIEVRQAPTSESSQNRSNSDSHQQHRGFDSQSQQSEQQRKEMVRKMWRKLAFGTDELDLVA